MDVQITKVLKNRFGRMVAVPENEVSLRAQLLAMSPTRLAEFLTDVIKQRALDLPSLEALRFLFDLDNKLYQVQGQASVRYGDGLHSKHRHINYHKFFTDNVESGESVLDIGSSRGELVTDIARKADPAKVIGIEIDDGRYAEAVAANKLTNLTFVHGDATKDLPDQHFDVVTLSNVLEHIEQRPELLRTLKDKYKPKRFLIRVPLFERDWRVPLKREVGMDYRLDDTHCIEYTQETFAAELAEAGLKVDTMQVRWGEIWAVIINA